MSKTPAKSAAPDGAQLSPGLQEAADRLGGTPVETADKDLPKRARVRSLVGDMRHLLTDKEVTSVEAMMDIDAFAAAQILAGKWEIVHD